MSQDIVADALNQIMNSKKANKHSLEIKNYSKLLISVLALAKLRGYVKDYKIIKKILKIEIGKLNNCMAVKPRYTIRQDNMDKYENRYLPTKGFGILVISTPQGIMTNHTAREKNMGGSLIAYMY